MTMPPRNEISAPPRRSSTRWDSRLARCTTYLARDYAPSEDELKEMAFFRKILVLYDDKESSGLLQNNADETTTRALSSIFFPNSEEQKSILLKRGPIQLGDNYKGDLMLFSRGLVLSNIDFDKIAQDTLNDEMIDGEDDGAGFDLNKIRKFYQGKGLPITEEELTFLFDKLDTNSDGLISIDDIRRLGQPLTMPASLQSLTSSNNSLRFMLGLSQKIDLLKKSLTSELDEAPQARKVRGSYNRAGSNNSAGSSSRSGSKSKVENALLFSDIDRVETLERWNSNDIKKCIPKEKDDGYDEVRIRQCSFAVFIRGKINQPLVVFCANPEEVKAWLEAFRICIGEQKSRVLGRKRGSVKSSKIFGINSPMRWWGDTKALSSSINWDEDD